MTAAQIETVTERLQPSLVGVIAGKEIRDAVASKWFWMWTVAFAGLAAFMAAAALPGSQVAGFGSFGRTAASLVALSQIIIPLMGLTLGAYSIAGQRESGALRFLLSHPISRSEAFIGTYLGLAVALGATVFGGFGVAGVITVAQGGGADASSFVRIALLSWLLAISMLGFGMLISTFTRRGNAALGVSIFVWLVFAFLGDLGVMATSVATKLPMWGLLVSAVLNPVEAFRLASLTAFSGSLDVLGPAGRYAVDTFGDQLGWILFTVATVWAVIPTLAAWARFSSGGDV
ncbi:MAG: ABC transporter permease subunit [Actinomycetota bacterium]|nr:ABC transporter permease subunit [Actinomycetota bacterium]